MVAVQMQRKVRSWCEECEAWHPLGQHIKGKRPESTPEPQAPEPRAPEFRAPELRADLRSEPRPVVVAPSAPRGSSLLRLAVFVFVIVPIGVVAWSAATYALMLIWPHIKAALG